jgi:hypothetical protein
MLVSNPTVPLVLDGLIDDAAVFPPGNAPLTEAVAAHRLHRKEWYAPMVGPLLVPSSAVDAGELSKLIDPEEDLAVGLIGDTGMAGLRSAAVAVPACGARLSQIEIAVAKRGEDPMTGLAELLDAVRMLDVAAFAEVPLTWGLLAALDRIAEARANGAPVAAKFRTGGLAAELFPTPMELAAVICACRERQLPFKLTAGLHHAIRHNDPETGFTHHGFVNVLAATLVADNGAEVIDVAEQLSATDPVPLIEVLRPRLSAERPLWTGFGSCSIPEPLADLARLGLTEPRRRT